MVPRGLSSFAAISLWLKPSKKESSTAFRWSGSSCLRALLFGAEFVPLVLSAGFGVFAGVRDFVATSRDSVLLWLVDAGGRRRGCG